MIDPPLISDGKISTGILPLFVSIFAPISSKGSFTLSIGLFFKDSSPSSRVENFCPDKRPVKSLAVVPEFPQSIVSGDWIYSLIPVPRVNIFPLFSANITPIAPTEYMVVFTSSESNKLLIFVISLLNVDKITALCDMDLSGGIGISP